MLLDRMIDFSCQCDGGWAGGLDGMGWDWLRDGGGKGRWDGGWRGGGGKGRWEGEMGWRDGYRGVGGCCDTGVIGGEREREEDGRIFWTGREGWESIVVRPLDTTIHKGSSLL